MAGQVVILMGSKSDLDHVNKITAQLDALGIAHTTRVASAHKSVQHLFGVLGEYGEAEGPIVFVAVAGRSNALAGMVDANTTWPVITCPPTSSAFGGADIYSSLRMPGGVAPTVVLEPEGAALAAAKVLGAGDAAVRARIGAYQQEMIEAILRADREVRAS